MNDEQLTATRNIIEWVEENLSDPEDLWLLTECKRVREYLGPDSPLPESISDDGSIAKY